MTTQNVPSRRRWLASAARCTLPLLAAGVALPASAAHNNHAYVVNQIDNTFSVIDMAPHAVTATIPVGITPVAAAVSPDGNHVYVVNSQANTVSVIDAAT